MENIFLVTGLLELHVSSSLHQDDLVFGQVILLIQCLKKLKLKLVKVLSQERVVNYLPLK